MNATDTAAKLSVMIDRIELYICTGRVAGR
jgi:hypothetical protein